MQVMTSLCHVPRLAHLRLPSGSYGSVPAGPPDAAATPNGFLDALNDQDADKFDLDASFFLTRAP